jgi:hypothetical protein
MGARWALWSARKGDVRPESASTEGHQKEEQGRVAVCLSVERSSQRLGGGG